LANTADAAHGDTELARAVHTVVNDVRREKTMSVPEATTGIEPVYTALQAAA
jgi:hypothetical protein